MALKGGLVRAAKAAAPLRMSLIHKTGSNYVPLLRPPTPASRLPAPLRVPALSRSGALESRGGQVAPALQSLQFLQPPLWAVGSHLRLVRCGSAACHSMPYRWRLVPASPCAAVWALAPPPLREHSGALLQTYRRQAPARLPPASRLPPACASIACDCASIDPVRRLSLPLACGRPGKTDAWRTHPMFTAQENLKKMFPGLGTGIV